MLQCTFFFKKLDDYKCTKEIKLGKSFISDLFKPFLPFYTLGALMVQYQRLWRLST